MPAVLDYRVGTKGAVAPYIECPVGLPILSIEDSLFNLKTAVDLGGRPASTGIH